MAQSHDRPKGRKCSALKYCIFCRGEILVATYGQNIFDPSDGRVTGALEILHSGSSYFD